MPFTHSPILHYLFFIFFSLVEWLCTLVYTQPNNHHSQLSTTIYNFLKASIFFYLYIYYIYITIKFYYLKILIKDLEILIKMLDLTFDCPNHKRKFLIKCPILIKIFKILNCHTQTNTHVCVCVHVYLCVLNGDDIFESHPQKFQNKNKIKQN